MDLVVVTAAQEQFFADTLLPLVKPAPKDQAESDTLRAGLIQLVYACSPGIHQHRYFVQTMNRAAKDAAKAIGKAADILEGTYLASYEGLVASLREDAAHLIPPAKGGRPRKDHSAKCVELCRAFLVAHGKHAGIGAEFKPEGHKPGGAVTLAEGVLELLTWSARTGEGDGTTTTALSSSAKRAKRARTKTPKKND
jgi:hypothetical protein